jgi:hypothetical protein
LGSGIRKKFIPDPWGKKALATLLEVNKWGKKYQISEFKTSINRILCSDKIVGILLIAVLQVHTTWP